MCEHGNSQNCYDCIKANNFDTVVGGAWAEPNDSYEQDNIDGSAGKFFGAILKTTVPNVIYNSPNGKVFKRVKAGVIIGTIQSYVEKGKELWWVLDNGKFVKHIQGNFDPILIESSLKKNEAAKKAEIEKKSIERQAANNNPLYKGGKKALQAAEDVGTGIADVAGAGVSIIGFLGKNLKWILIIGIVLLILIVAAYSYKSFK